MGGTRLWFWFPELLLEDCDCVGPDIEVMDGPTLDIPPGVLTWVGSEEVPSDA